MSSPNSELRRPYQLDFIDSLHCPSHPNQGEALVVSAELKVIDNRVEAEILVTGYVHDYHHDDPAQSYLVPLLAIQLPLASAYQPGLPPRERAAYTEQLGKEALKAMFCELTQLARISLRSGGLRDISIALKDLSSDSLNAARIDLRDFRQTTKMQIALAHTDLHWKLRQDKNLQHFEFGKYRIPRSLVYFADLYSLARAIGVKEVRPRVQSTKFYLDALRDYRKDGLFAKPRRNASKGDLDQQTGRQKSVTEQTEFTVLVAKLKRAKLIQNRP